MAQQYNPGDHFILTHSTVVQSLLKLLCCIIFGFTLYLCMLAGYGDKSTTRKVQNEEVDDALLLWFHQERNRGFSISVPILQEKDKI